MTNKPFIKHLVCDGQSGCWIYGLVVVVVVWVCEDMKEREKER